MKIELRKVFVAVLTRYNFSQPFMNMTKDFDEYPTESELIEFVKECNLTDPTHKNFGTDVRVNIIHKVI